MKNIEKKTEELKKTVKKSETGHLPLKDRVNLLTLLNNATTVNKILFECVKKVYPIWEKQYPKNETMIDLLNKSNAFLYEGIGNKKDFRKYNDDNFTYFESLDGLYAIIGLAVCTSCFSIGCDASLILQIEDYEGQDDNDYDYDVWNADFLASIAYAGGNPFVSEGSVSKRKEFWLWYLDTVLQYTVDSSKPQIILNLPKLSFEEESHTEYIRTQTTQNESVLILIKDIIKQTNDLVNQINIKWDKIEIESCCMYGGISASLFYWVDNQKNKIDFVTYFSECSSINELFDKIKEEMYQQAPREGAWIMSNMIIEKDQSYIIAFNYDDIDTFVKRAKNPMNLTGEFEMCPRAKEFTPQWWQDILGKKAKYLK